MTATEYRSPILCSVLIPTHDRVDDLHRCIESVFSEAKDPSRVEAIVRLDFEDRNTLEHLTSLSRPYPNVRAIVSHRMDGFDSLPIFDDECARLARGDWIWLFNDDAWIDGAGWDAVLEKAVEQFQNKLFPRFYPQYQWDGTSCYENAAGGTFPIIGRHLWKHWELGKVNGGGIDHVVGKHEHGVDVFLPGIGVRHTSRHK
jgi:hypothetical protein